MNKNPLSQEQVQIIRAKIEDILNSFGNSVDGQGTAFQISD